MSFTILRIQAFKLVKASSAVLARATLKRPTLYYCVVLIYIILYQDGLIYSRDDQISFDKSTFVWLLLVVWICYQLSQPF